MSSTKFNIERGCYFDSSESNLEERSEPKGCPGCSKLSSTDWLLEYGTPSQTEIFEVKFKNTRRGFYANVNNLALKRGDIVAVEASPGHDIGVISLSGDLVSRQMRRTGFRTDGVEFKKIYRKAKAYDIEKWQEAIALEHQTMIESRQIASDLGLNMKIGDVEYQGDRLKAIFYYIADERVDFRELIKIFAERFRIRIEMKQIGARQEAGRIGGIGSCGRELCCAKFITNFVSVTTNSARFQEILLNPQKLAGQCGKLKCCMNYEVDAYIDARKSFPKINEPLESLDAKYFLIKSDIFKKEMTFSTDPSIMANLVTISTDRAWEVIKLNRKGIKVDRLDNVVIETTQSPDYQNVVGQESITRFDSSRDRRKGRKSGTNRSGGNKNERNSSENGENRPSQPRGERRNNRQNGGENGATNNNSQKGENRENGRSNNRERRPIGEKGGRPPRQPRQNEGNENSGTQAQNNTPKDTANVAKQNGERGDRVERGDRPNRRNNNNRQQRGKFNREKGEQSGQNQENKQESRQENRGDNRREPRQDNKPKQE
ncbi:MAG: regulatory iron-sulfur-containing complex subunit RicT [Rikenellaceae bacterium]